MGIDYDVIFVFGMEIPDEHIDKIREHFGEYAFTVDCDIAETEYPKLFFKYASPYYNADENEYRYFVSLIEPGITELTMDDVKLLINSDLVEYKRFLNDFDIPYEEPRFFVANDIY